MNNVLIQIKDKTVIIFDNGLKMVSLLSDWKSDSKDDILLEYKSLKSKMEGGENI